jgi:hypothetical protein
MVNRKLVLAARAPTAPASPVAVGLGRLVALGWLVAPLPLAVGVAEPPPHALRAIAMTATKTTAPRLWVWENRSI